MSSSSINPIIPGFAPDPSIILLDGTFFLVNSTFHMFPGLPIYASKDLITWKHIGNAIHRQSQLSLKFSLTRLEEKDSAGDVMHNTGGLYASTIRHHNGTVYIVCTNVLHADSWTQDQTENFIVSTTDIWAGEWSDAILFSFRGIDPSIFFDSDGRSYIQGSAAPGPMTRIHLFEIDLRTGEKLSEEKEIWKGTGGEFPEGPHLYKKDEWYYVVISEGGTFEGHMITVARSRDIWGPYEAFERNPILTARDTEEYIRATGHCDLMQDAQGQWWGVCLGVRKERGRYVMGRETFLTPGEWAPGEWPKLSQVKMNPILPTGKELSHTGSQPRLTASPMVDYLYIRDAQLDDHRFSRDGRTLTLIASRASFSQWQEPVTFVGKRQRTLEGTTSVLMHKPTKVTAGFIAGLAYYKDEHRYMKLFYDCSSSEIVFEVIVTSKQISKIVRQKVELERGVSFRLEYTELLYKFSYSIDSNSEGWISFEAQDTLDMTAPDFIGPVIGCFANSAEGGGEAVFENLEVE
ncbi:glycoside hydrolase family 43 protein [Hyaloscypha variabilis F]|uniref:Glycoside hydrolase family 43 protein n=1 Tax=Hyaloscypha variabilis (strain UAMH 11265 / GT02V1 / F) TaxID=1149755 RepID=A0A2J6S8J4_HYAVF|nr:glycoside hydrolase family 43 protein [Hyaloscypha variabilis F]